MSKKRETSIEGKINKNTQGKQKEQDQQWIDTSPHYRLTLRQTNSRKHKTTKRWYLKSDKNKTANTGHCGIWLHNRSGHVLRELPTNSRNFQNKNKFKTYTKPQPTSFGGVNEAQNPAHKNLHEEIETKICFCRLSLPSVSSPSFLSLSLSLPLHPLLNSHVPHPSMHPTSIHPHAWMIEAYIMYAWSRLAIKHHDVLFLCSFIASCDVVQLGWVRWVVGE